MAAERFARAAAVMFVAVTVAMSPVRAEEKRVVDELLDILRQNKQISDQQYRQLKQRAESERLRDEGGEQVAAPTPTAAAPAAAVAAATPALPKGAAPLQAYWKDGFNIGTADESFRLKIGGRIQNDWAVAASSDGLRDEFDIAAVETGTELRRARIDLQGYAWHIVNFRLEYDFATGEAEAQDVYIGLSKVPWVQNIRVGHFKEPFELEQMTSNNDVTFMERGIPHALVPARNTGLALFGSELGERMTWEGGVFALADNTGFGFGAADNYDLTGRVTGLPWAADDAHFVHLGLAYSHQFRSDDFSLSYSQRPESHLYPVALVKTGGVPTNGVDLLGAEAALVYGSFSAQGEYNQSFVSIPGAADANVGGFYTFASYFLTGESRPYKRSRGHFDRVRPLHNLAFDGSGLGAWEIAARFSWLDLNSVGVRGGQMADVTAGINWYLNPNVRVMFNYVHAHLQATGDANIAQSRFQFAF